MIREEKLNNAWFLLAIGILICVADYLVFGFGIITKEHDGSFFLTALQFFKTGHFPPGINPTADVFARIERPLEVSLAWLLSSVFSPGFSFYIVNSILFIMNGIMLFKLYECLFGKDSFAFYAALFYYFNIIPMHFGLTILAETAWQFCYLLSLFLIFKFFLGRNEIKWRFYVISGLVISLGFFAKETVIVSFAVMAFLLYNRLREGYPFRKAFWGIILSFIVFLIPVVLWQLWLYQKFHHGFFQWMTYHYSVAGQLHKATLFRLVLSVGTAFNLLLIPYLLSLIRSKSDRLLSVLLLILGIIVPAATINLIDRLVFQMFPAIILFSTFYLFREGKPALGRIFFGVYAAMNVALLVLYRSPSIYEHFYAIIRKM